MNDLIERLRNDSGEKLDRAANEAADELERLIALDSESKLALDKFNKQLMTENSALRKELAALKAQSTEQPVAWAVKQEYARAEDSDEIVWESIWDHPSFANDHVNQQYEMQSDGYLPKAKRSVVPLYTTPPTAAALVEDFKRGAVEVCMNKAKSGTQLNFAGGCEWCASVIESLPLIKGEKE